MLSLVVQGRSQTRIFDTGLLPSAALSKSIHSKLKATLKVESMHGMFSILQGEEQRKYRYFRTDLQGFLAWKLGPFWNLAAGYQYRTTSASNSSRTIQQVTYLQKLTRFRIGHRFRTDQTFAAERKIRYRIRYRISFDIPLQGVELDPKEWYVVGMYEGLFDTRQGDVTFENRWGLVAGYFFNRTHKLETGPEYRGESWLDDEIPAHRLWWKLNWYITLK